MAQHGISLLWVLQGKSAGVQNIIEAKAFFSSSGMQPLSCGMGKEKLTKFFLYVSFIPQLFSLDKRF